MGALVRWLLSPFAWRVVRDQGVWVYSENAITGRRQCWWRGAGYSPVDYTFMRKGDLIIGPRGREVVR